jgi:hypothetical protein
MTSDHSAAAPQTRPPTSTPARPVRVWDLVLSIVLLVLLLGFAALAAFAGAFLALASDPCGGTMECDFDRMNFGIVAAMISPVVLAGLGLVVTIRQLVRRRLAYWVPIVTAALIALVWVCCAILVSSAVPGYTQ